MTPSEIAKGLSKAQRASLMLLERKWRTSFGILYRRDGRYADRYECSAMTRGYSQMPQLVEKNPALAGSLGGTGIRLTPLGVKVQAAVRAILEQESRGE